MIDLFECERLNARISAATCEANRKRTGHQQIWACQGCPGLGQKIDDNEVSAMAQRCSVAKCEKLAQHGCDGMCKSHYRKHLQAIQTDPVVSSSEVKQAASGHYGHEDGCDCAVCEDVNHWSPRTQVVSVPASSGESVNVEGPGVSFRVDALVLQAIREAWAETEARLLPQLSGLKPSVALVRAAKVVEQLEGIGC